jgi:hypothetical protein
MDGHTKHRALSAILCAGSRGQTIPQLLICIIGTLALAFAGGTYLVSQHNPGIPGYEEVQTSFTNVRNATQFGVTRVTYAQGVVTTYDAVGNVFKTEKLTVTPTFIWNGGGPSSTLTFTLTPNGNAAPSIGSCAGLELQLGASKWPITCTPLSI